METMKKLTSIFTVLFACLFSVPSAMAEIELNILSENIIDATAGTETAGPRDLDVRVARDASGMPVIVYATGNEVRIFWCDDLSCSSGTNELVLEKTLSAEFELSDVDFDVYGGPNFIASVEDYSGYWTYVQCSDTTCANATEWDLQGAPPATPMYWNQNSQLIQQTGLLLKQEDNSAPIILTERMNKGIDYFDCDDGQNCDPMGYILGQQDTQWFILDSKRSATPNVTEVISRTREYYTYDMMFTSFECDANKDCTRTTDATLDTDQFEDLFDGNLGYDWSLNVAGSGEIKDGKFDNDGNPVLTLQYSTGVAPPAISADMSAMVRCSDALCSNTSVTMIDAVPDMATGAMDTHVAFRTTTGLPFFSYRLCGDGYQFNGCDLKVKACETASCDAGDATAILSENTTIGTHAVINVEDDGIITLAHRNSDGELVFSRIEIWTQIMSDAFEAGWGNYIDGGRKCKLIDNADHAHGGTYSVQIEEDTGEASSFYTGQSDLSAYSQIEVSFWFKFKDFEDGDDFVVEFYDGANWQNVASFARGAEYDNGIYYNPTVTIDTYDFSNAAFRFRSTAGKKDKMNIDDIVISAR